MSQNNNINDMPHNINILTRYPKKMVRTRGEVERRQNSQADDVRWNGRRSETDGETENDLAEDL